MGHKSAPPTVLPTECVFFKCRSCHIRGGGIYRRHERACPWARAQIDELYIAPDFDFPVEGNVSGGGGRGFTESDLTLLNITKTPTAKRGYSPARRQH